MAEELGYHEQNEGWKHEWLADSHCVCFMRPREIGGGFMTVDFECRLFSTGYGKPRQGATATAYTGKGWKDRIVRDAIDHLERVMSDTGPATSQTA
ncbi:hypothetical protein [Pseudoduganella buxea]|uniref:Uncharacterized protein n=1 Tax=Pseudoduganella buxea TaxID=1949069 RepID=A0A6I3T4M1_9BURK|nr:hypothetical protein [Pseudoduganella buxea]MTV56369.1 hypothetical protein [Pseudoduganella buxea]GGC25437.1 hypothetical protein GCM10011572_53550 [Pseudoduganella buxea]